MPDKRVDDGEDRERAMRMLAMQIVAQLPSDPREANYILGLAREFLNEFLNKKPDENRKPLRCVT